VLADQVHPARRTHHYGRFAEFPTEACKNRDKEWRQVSGAEAKMLHGQLREKN
jgi:hypothetical protein